MAISSPVFTIQNHNRLRAGNSSKQLLGNSVIVSKLLLNQEPIVFPFHMDPISKAAAYLMSYRKNLVLLSMVLGSGPPIVFLLLYADPQIYNGKVYKFRQSTTTTINPDIFLSDDLISKIEKSINKLKPCTPHPLLGSNKTHIWIEKENLPHYKLNNSEHIVCCYRSFYRPTSIPDITSSQIDSRINYNKCRNFSDSIKIGVRDEFVRVNCSQTKKLFDSFFLLAREKKILTKPKKDLDYNILILGIDAVSRLNLHRTMPKTVAFMSKLGAVELLRYNKVGDNSFPNLMPLLLGKSETELQETCWPHDRLTFDNCPFIWEWFQQAGFATALGEDNAYLGTFNYLKKRGFAGTPTNYYLYPFIREAETIAGSNKDRNAKLCMNEKFFFQILLDYVADITTVTKNKLFGFFWEITMSHDNLNYPMVMDDSYRAFFRQMLASGYLHKTIIVLMSDHGMRFGTFRKTRQGFLEDRLPFIFALMPPSFRINFSEAYKNLKLNVRSLTTPYDVHATLTDLINLDKIKDAKIISRTKESYSSKRGISLFLPIPRNRTCKSAAIDDHWCVEYKNAIVEANSTEVKEAIRYVMSHLNSLLQDYPQCAKLSLSKVLFVTRLLSNSPKKNNESIELSVGFQTHPGGGEFEATLEREGGVNSSWSLAGSTSRLNAYGNQSYCAPTDELKLYCYCIDTTSGSAKATLTSVEYTLQLKNKSYFN